MTPTVTVEGDRLIWRKYDLTLWIEPWGPDAVRVRATRNAQMPPDSEVLLQAKPSGVEIACSNAGASAARLTTGATDLAGANLQTEDKIANGELVVELNNSSLCFRRQSDNRVLLRANELISCDSDAQGFTGAFTSLGGGLWRVEADFKAYADEKFFGLGQHRHGLLNQKGCVLDLVHHNCEINIPFALSNRGYGFIWNNPAVGRVELAENRTRWVADACRSLDYVVIAGRNPSAILHRYADITGHCPPLPDWAAGFWQSKMRYKMQDELLSVAHQYKQRDLPLSVIVIDFLHWISHGDWKLDPQYWPDPAGMIRQLEQIGVRVMVSFWPTVNRESENFSQLLQGGMLAGAGHGLPAMLSFPEAKDARRVFLYLTDPTNPAARRFVWEKIRENYVRHGFRIFWLDAIEPELITQQPDFENIRYHAGEAKEIAGLYPWYCQKLFFDGMKAQGQQEIITLGRSAFLGSARFAAAVWSGDIQSSFKAMEASIPAGLNIGLSGIPWWTTDIGGFWGGNIESDEFRELIVRWFQYGVFCPLFRLHGDRNGGQNEVWSFGDRAYEIIRQVLFMRERLRPYIMQQMDLASRTGLPAMRPMFVDFPDDGTCWDIKDQFLFGPDILVCPVTKQGATQRQVYLPAGADWTDAFGGKTLSGGQSIQADAPLERIPVYLKSGAEVPIYDGRKR